MGLKFSIVTVVFNAEEVIEKTMTSVLNQTYLPYEYIIIDGSSTDKTIEVIEKMVPLFNEKGIKCVFVSEKDNGIYNAMNKGIKLACGDFVSFLNSGDWYEPDALESINSFYMMDKFDLTYGGLHYIKPDGTVIDKMSKLDKFPITSRHWNHPSMFLKCDLYKKYNFDENYKAYADFDLYLKLRKTSIKIRVIDKVIANFVSGGVSTNSNMKNVMARAKEKYSAYINNGYSHVYWLEAYGWEILKALYLRAKK